ncbi:MAG TPA: deoxyribodipyrimidine photo-lyase [Burkholderiaceae bacterium]
MSSYNKTLVWFRRDLRVHDNAALHNALTTSKQMYCVFIYDTAILQSLPRRDRRVEFIHASVGELAQGLQQLGGALIVRHADAATALVKLAAELGVDAVFCNRDYEPAAIARDTAVAQALAGAKRELRDFKDHVIYENREVVAQSGQPFSVFTPYKNAWLRTLHNDPNFSCLHPYEIEKYADRFAASTHPVAASLPTLEQLGFEKTNLAELAIPVGTSGAQTLVADFLPRMAHYNTTRDFPSVRGPSYLSVHLRFGTVSIRQLVMRALEGIASGTGGEGAAVWLSELIWRDFYSMILYHNPHSAAQAYKRAYDAIEWETGPQADAHFAAWAEGRTGYPLVDAAMLQLLHTGYMHNRLRMVSACFLVKDLGLDWRRGEDHFALHLNDFDQASNNGGWQWAASTGCDAQPYFRIFNPVTQSEKFDGDGKFIRRYLPQLARLPNKYIHAPWLAPIAVLKEAGVLLDQNYPAPVVVHEDARKLTMQRYAVIKPAATA